ncbi:MAG TPA: MerR family transcriptional regulator [Phenylobacterium sp.]
MQTSELARRAQLTTRQVRHYEREGLIGGRRDENGHRDYPPETASVARRIGHLVDLGFTTGEIRTFIDRISPPAAGAASPKELLHRRERLARIDATIETLRATRAELMELLVSDVLDA